MILDTIDNIDTIKYIKRSPALQEAFEWFKNTPEDIEEGTYELRGKDLYVIVTSFDTQPREDCIFESHRTYVDVQFMIEGGEIIDWSPIKLLTPQDEYNEEGDYILYPAPEETPTSLQMKPGRFAIFFPEDGHSVKINDGINSRAKKWVAKISLEFLNQ